VLHAPANRTVEIGARFRLQVRIAEAAGGIDREELVGIRVKDPERAGWRLSRRLALVNWYAALKRSALEKS
jgi:hypothetical protein